MQKINSILVRYLRGEAHYQFMTLFGALLERFPQAKAFVDALLPEFYDLLMQEKALVDAQKSSDYTMQIAEADHRDDSLLVGIFESVSAALRHFDPAVVAAAVSINNRLKTFSGVIKKTYEEEAAAIDILLTDLTNPEFAPKVATVGITAWVNELSLAVAEFNSLLQLRNAEKAQKPQTRLRDIRKKMDDTYRKITARISAADALDDTAAYTGFINELNAQIDYFNEHNHRQAKIDIADAEPEAIPQQQYTGQPVTPTPKVLYTAQKEGTTTLELGKDYNLTYKNNTKAGNAECTLHGKGKYKGSKTVSFLIVNG